MVRTSKQLAALRAGGLANLKHGHAKVDSPTYRSWRRMKARCLDPKNRSFASYGGRGITVCARWMTFENFLADMGTRPSCGHTLDRKDGTLGYSPDNCRWATHKEQIVNRAYTRKIVHSGNIYTCLDLSRKLGVSRRTIMRRVARGELLEAA